MYITLIESEHKPNHDISGNTHNNFIRYLWSFKQFITLKIWNESQTTS